MASLDAYVDGEPLTTVNADGLIVATQTGSTAYALSAGGSILSPNTSAICFVPICPHTLSFRPLLFPDSAVIRLEVPSDARASAWCAFDGRNQTQLQQGDFVVVRSCLFPLPLVCRGSACGDWIRAIKCKLYWNVRTRQKALQTRPRGRAGSNAAGSAAAGGGGGRGGAAAHVRGTGSRDEAAPLTASASGMSCRGGEDEEEGGRVGGGVGAAAASRQAAGPPAVAVLSPAGAASSSARSAGGRSGASGRSGAGGVSSALVGGLGGIVAGRGAPGDGDDDDDDSEDDLYGEGEEGEGGGGGEAAGAGWTPEEVAHAGGSETDGSDGAVAAAAEQQFSGVVEGDTSTTSSSSLADAAAAAASRQPSPLRVIASPSSVASAASSVASSVGSPDGRRVAAGGAGGAPSGRPRIKYFRTQRGGGSGSNSPAAVLLGGAGAPSPAAAAAAVSPQKPSHLTPAGAAGGAAAGLAASAAEAEIAAAGVVSQRQLSGSQGHPSAVTAPTAAAAAPAVAAASPDHHDLGPVRSRSAASPLPPQRTLPPRHRAPSGSSAAVLSLAGGSGFDGAGSPEPGLVLRSPSVAAQAKADMLDAAIQLSESAEAAESRRFRRASPGTFASGSSGSGSGGLHHHPSFYSSHGCSSAGGAPSASSAASAGSGAHPFASPGGPQLPSSSHAEERPAGRPRVRSGTGGSADNAESGMPGAPPQ